jgi:hypothetical protein
MMTREILYYLILISLTFFWIFFVLRLIYRLFGLCLPLNPLKPGNVKFSPSQHIFLNGVLGYGVAMFIFIMSDHYLKWKFHGTLSDQPTLALFVHNFCVWIFNGFLFGCIMYAANSKVPKDKQPPS